MKEWITGMNLVKNGWNNKAGKQRKWKLMVFSPLSLKIVYSSPNVPILKL